MDKRKFALYALLILSLVLGAGWLGAEVYAQLATIVLRGGVA